MSLSIGIVGLPNVGKSTLFNALTKAGALAANYPFATIEPNVGVVGVPDPRLGALGKLYNSARLVPASVRFTDIAGLVKGASQGQGLGNQFLGHIRETDAICQVVRVFHDPDVTRVEGSAEPEGDIETVVTELILADLQTLEKAAPRLAKETKFTKDPEKLETAAAAQAAVSVLDSGKTLFAGAAAAGISLAALRELHLMTAKPFLYVFNMDVGELADEGLKKQLAGPGRARPRRSSSTRRPRPTWPSSPTRRRPSCSPRRVSASRALPSWPRPASAPSACRPS